jgi:hypothetical protein
MIAAEGVTPVVAATTVPGVGEHHVIPFVVADPGVAAFGLGEILCFAT